MVEALGQGDGGAANRKRDPWASPPRAGGFELDAPGLRTGSERFCGAELSLADFWTWAFGDLAVNITRSRVAEFLVARALGDARPMREEWADYDVLTPDGIRVEVKSAAYLPALATVEAVGHPFQRVQRPQLGPAHRLLRRGAVDPC